MQIDTNGSTLRSGSWSRRPKRSRNEAANITYGARHARNGGTTVGSSALRGNLQNSSSGSPTGSLHRAGSSPALLNQSTSSSGLEGDSTHLPPISNASKSIVEESAGSPDVRFFLTSYWSSHFSRSSTIMVPIQSGAGVSSQRKEQPGCLRVLCDLRAFRTEMSNKMAYLIALDADHLRTVALGCGKDTREASSSWIALECMCGDRVPLKNLCEEVSIKIRPRDPSKKNLQVLLRVAVAPLLSPLSQWKALGDGVMVRVSGLCGVEVEESMVVLIRKLCAYSDWWRQLPNELSNEVLVQALRSLMKAAASRGLPYETLSESIDKLLVHKEWWRDLPTRLKDDSLVKAFTLMRDACQQRGLNITEQALRKGDRVRIVNDGPKKGETGIVVEQDGSSVKIRLEEGDGKAEEFYSCSTKDVEHVVTADDVVREQMEALRRRAEKIEKEMDSLKQSSSSDIKSLTDELDVSRHQAFRKGDRVRVVEDGPLHGLLGSVLDPNSGDFVKIQLEGGGSEEASTGMLLPTNIELVKKVEEYLEERLEALGRDAFKIGDRVRVVKDCSIQGEVGAVLDPNCDSFVKIQLEGGIKEALIEKCLPTDIEMVQTAAELQAEQLEMARRNAFRRGDQVRILKDESLKKGELGMLLDPSSGKVQFEGGDEELLVESFLPAEMEVVKTAAAYMEEKAKASEEDLGAQIRELQDRLRLSEEALDNAKRAAAMEEEEHQRKQQEAEERERKRIADEEEAARRRKQQEEEDEEASRLAEERRRIAEEDEAKRKAFEEEERRRIAEEDEARRREQEDEDARKRGEQEEEARRLAEIEALKTASRTRLRVKVLQAQHLRAADWGGSSDPYVVVKMGHQKDYGEHQPFTTDIVKKNLNPHWDQEYIFDACLLDDEILFEVWDHDDGKKDDFLGSAILTPEEYRPEGFCSYMPLGEKKKRKSIISKPFRRNKKRSTMNVDASEGPVLWVEIEVLPMVRIPSMPRCFVEIKSGKDLRAADKGGKSDPYCICELVHKPASRFQTAIIKKTLDPVWGEEREMVGYKAGDEIQIAVYDHDGGKKKGDPLGNVILHSYDFHPDGFDGSVTLLGEGAGLDSKVQIKVDIY